MNMVISKYEHLKIPVCVRVWDLTNKQKSLFLSTRTSDFYGKGTPFLCLLRYGTFHKETEGKG